MRTRPGIELAGLSDVGCCRQNNEDRYSYWEPDTDALFWRKGRLALVADGMGGYEGGQEASRIAAEAIEDVYASVPDGDIDASLLAAFQEAHRRIRSYASHHVELNSMGTTCTAVVLAGRQLHYAHVGDSRLYLVRDGKISRLTHDHSYVGRLIEQGVLRPEEGESHPQRHILTAALGAGNEIVPDIPVEPVSIKKGDILVLCTDGLWGLLSDKEICAMVAEKKPAEACHELVQMAKDRGAPDNITVQVIRITGAR